MPVHPYTDQYTTIRQRCTRHLSESPKGNYHTIFMNLYIRYFNDEFLAHNVDEAIDFLASLKIEDFDLGEAFRRDLKSYAQSDIPYPKRYKVHSRVYFIVIKTLADNLADFKTRGSMRAEADTHEETPFQAKKKMKTSALNEIMPGWYDGTLTFKRVIAIPGTNKFQYKDTRFRAQCKAQSPIDCYNRIVEHLKNRQDVDSRSQFSSAKGKNFTYTYLGDKRPAMPQEA